MAETSKRTFSLPTDVSDRLAREGNASAYVTDAVRARMRREGLAGALATAGIVVTEEGAGRARAARMAVEAAWPQARRQAARDRARNAALADVEPQAPAA